MLPQYQLAQPQDIPRFANYIEIFLSLNTPTKLFFMYASHLAQRLLGKINFSDIMDD